MDTQKIHYCFILSDDQMEFLRSKKYKIDRMECFLSMATLAVRETKLEPISKTQQVKILPGQLMIDNTKLAQDRSEDSGGYGVTGHFLFSEDWRYPHPYTSFPLWMVYRWHFP